MPVSSQALYFHLCQKADDDGVVEAWPVMQLGGFAEDDIKVLASKEFVKILNEHLVSFIFDWREHNTIRRDRKIDSIYKDLLLQVLPDIELVKSTQRSDVAKPSHRLSGQSTDSPRTVNGRRRLGKVRLGKVREIQAPASGAGLPTAPKFNPLGAEIIKAFEEVDPKNKTYYANKTQRKACDHLLDTYGLEEVLKRIRVLPQTNKVPYFPKINSPDDLKEKWVKLQDAVDTKRQEKAEKNKSNYVI